MGTGGAKVSWQLDWNDLRTREYDVAVVGAGPAGCATAFHLAKAGHKTFLIDKYRFPRRKVCGDGLIADSLAYFKRNGLYEDIASAGRLSSRAIVISPSGYSFECPGDFVVLARDQLDTILARRAVEIGVDFACGEIDDIAYLDSDRLELQTKTSGQVVRASCAVLATGGQAVLASRVGLRNGAKPHAFAISQYFESTCSLDNLIINFDRDLLPGFSWIWPMKDGRYNVGAGTTYHSHSKPGVVARLALDRLMDHTDAGQAISASGQFVSELRGAPIYCSFKGVKPHDGRRTLIVGETLGTTYPFSGEGVGMALESGELAAQVISEALRSNDFSLLTQYADMLNTRLKPKYRNYEIAEKWFAKPRLSDFLCRRLGHSSYLMDKFAEFAAGRSSGTGFLNVPILLKSLWK